MIIRLIVPWKTVRITSRRSPLALRSERRYAKRPGPFVPSGRVASSLLMNEISASPVIPSGLAAQSRQRYGGSMAGLKRFPSSFASVSRTCSMSSRNFRNMTHVSIGRRSRSPFRPLSLRMMSRQDLTRLPKAWAVVRGAASDFLPFGMTSSRFWRRVDGALLFDMEADSRFRRLGRRKLQGSDLLVQVLQRIVMDQ